MSTMTPPYPMIMTSRHHAAGGSLPPAEDSHGHEHKPDTYGRFSPAQKRKRYPEYPGMRAAALAALPVNYMEAKKLECHKSLDDIHTRRKFHRKELRKVGRQYLKDCAEARDAKVEAYEMHVEDRASNIYQISAGLTTDLETSKLTGESLQAKVEGLRSASNRRRVQAVELRQCAWATYDSVRSILVEDNPDLKHEKLDKYWHVKEMLESDSSKPPEQCMIKFKQFANKRILLVFLTVIEEIDRMGKAAAHGGLPLALPLAMDLLRGRLEDGAKALTDSEQQQVKSLMTFVGQHVADQLEKDVKEARPEDGFFTDNQNVLLTAKQQREAAAAARRSVVAESAPPSSNDDSIMRASPQEPVAGESAPPSLNDDGLEEASAQGPVAGGSHGG